MSLQKSNLRQLAAFFLLVFAVGWLGWIPLLASPQGQRWIAFVFLFSPAISACVVAAWADGSSGVRDIFRRYFLWRFHIQWYLLALLFVPAVFLATLLISSGELPKALWTNSPIYFVAASFLYLMFITSGEEIGWRGFALPRLQAIIGNPWLAGITLGIAWGAWHLPEYFLPGPNIPLLPFLVFIAGLSTVYTVLFNNTQGSLLLAVLLHASTDVVPRIVQIGSFPLKAWWLIAGLTLISGIVLHVATNKLSSNSHAIRSEPNAGQDQSVRYNHD